MIVDKDRGITTYMSYTESHDKQRGVTVFGREERGLFYNYDDRLMGFDGCKPWRECLTEAAAQLKLESMRSGVMTARAFELALSMFHGKPVDLRHIILGCNVSNGYSWLCFGYIMGE